MPIRRNLTTLEIADDVRLGAYCELETLPSDVAFYPHVLARRVDTLANVEEIGRYVNELTCEGWLEPAGDGRFRKSKKWGGR